MGQSCMDIGIKGGENGETPRSMKIPIRHMKYGEDFGPSPRFEERKRRFMIKALQRPPRGFNARFAARGHKIDREAIISHAQQLGLSLESIAPYLNAFSTTTTTTGTNAEAEGGSKGLAAEPIGTKAEGIHDYPLKSLPSSESLVVDTNPARDSAAGTASTSGTKA